MGQILDIGAERVARQVRLESVRPAAGVLGDNIARVVDDVGVVAGPPIMVSAPVLPSSVSVMPDLFPPSCKNL